jgi:glycosyltransferase involved in cell wall biosynthesis
MKVLSIGPDKELLTPGSAAFERHVQYAAQVEVLHAVVFARTQYGTARVTIADNAWSYPTGSSSVLELFVGAYRAGRRILREPGEWVISAQDPFESAMVGYVLAKMTGTPLLIQEHGDFFSTPHWRRESLVNQVRYRIGRFLIRRATHVRVVSERIQETLVALGIPPARISVTPVYTDTSAFAAAAPDQTIRALGTEGDVVILTMARFVPQKNLALLINAFGLILKQGVHARLVLIGKGVEQAMLERLAREVGQGKITFRAWTDTPASALKAADIYALSSNYEGWGRVCIEALASGVPLIMTEVGCAGSVVRNGEHGIVVPVGDLARFAAGLHLLASDAQLRSQLRERGLQQIAALPPIEQNVVEYIHSLTTCLQQHTTHPNV